MTQEIMTMEEMLADLDLPPAPTNSPSKVKDKFLLTQYNLLSTPYFVIYLQGRKGAALATVELEESDMLELAFKEAVFRRVGRNTPPNILALLPSIEANKAKFYTDKEWHKNTILSLLSANDLPISKETSATRAYPLAAIESYLSALASYLVSFNLTLEAFLNPTTNTTKLTLDDLSSAWDSL